MIAHGPDGVLHGPHGRRRTGELAGKTVEPGETFAEAPSVSSSRRPYASPGR